MGKTYIGLQHWGFFAGLRPSAQGLTPSTGRAWTWSKGPKWGPFFLKGREPTGRARVSTSIVMGLVGADVGTDGFVASV